MRHIQLLTVFLILLIPQAAFAETVPDWNRLANAIYKAEGGAKTKHPYGIIAHYTHTSPRQACLNTLKHQYAIYLRLKARRTTFKKTFLCHLQGVYAPVGALNDPYGLNRNWLKNVEYFYGKYSKI